MFRKFIVFVVLFLFVSVSFFGLTASEEEENQSKKILYRNFGVTTARYDDDSNWDEIVNDLFGSEYRVADWNDLKAFYNNGGDLLDLYDGLGMTNYKNSAYVKKNGVPSYSSTRYYFASRHDHNKPSNYLAHDSIDNYLLSLGSWYGSNKILAIKKDSSTIKAKKEKYVPELMMDGSELGSRGWGEIYSLKKVQDKLADYLTYLAFEDFIPKTNISYHLYLISSNTNFYNVMNKDLEGYKLGEEETRFLMFQGLDSSVQFDKNTGDIKRAQLAFQTIGKESEKYGALNENVNDTFLNTEQYKGYLENDKLFHNLEKGERALFLITSYMFTRNFNIALDTNSFFGIIDNFLNSEKPESEKPEMVFLYNDCLYTISLDNNRIVKDSEGNIYGFSDPINKLMTSGKLFMESKIMDSYEQESMLSYQKALNTYIKWGNIGLAARQFRDFFTAWGVRSLLSLELGSSAIGALKDYVEGLGDALTNPITYLKLWCQFNLSDLHTEIKEFLEKSENLNNRYKENPEAAINMEEIIKLAATYARVYSMVDPIQKLYLSLNDTSLSAQLKEMGTIAASSMLSLAGEISAEKLSKINTGTEYAQEILKKMKIEEAQNLMKLFGEIDTIMSSLFSALPAYGECIEAIDNNLEMYIGSNPATNSLLNEIGIIYAK